MTYSNCKAEPSQPSLLGVYLAPPATRDYGATPKYAMSPASQSKTGPLLRVDQICLKLLNNPRR
jgi:hypothetical protein